MRETVNKHKWKQSNSDFTANVSLYMFIVIPIALTVSMFSPCSEKWSSSPLFYCLQHKISLPKRVKWVFVCLSLMPFSLWQPSIHLKCVLHNCHRRESFHLWNTSGGNKRRKETGGWVEEWKPEKKAEGAIDKMCKRKKKQHMSRD